ncbi:Sas10 domain-containing protein [Paramicrosporidium saccamoebae]|uniref:Sas10 domain-containing protein n=1 Tax=Paramicrosporidium saccamoebae TaxID=1246581 RepID=A0A2H9TPP3_9FUNG|nr:Sas10 domain-containing protein [Paramicrosporidium saccamoebae]
MSKAKIQAQREKILLEESDGSQGYSDTEEAVMDLPSDSEEEAWGRSKKTFYSADASSEDLKDEAAEARKLQRKQLSSMSEDDFVKSRVALSKSGPVTLDLSDDDDDILEDKYASESDLVGLDVESLEVLLPEDEKLEIIEKHAPETKQFLGEFRKSIAEMRNHIEPVLGKLKASKTDKGLCFLETKYQLLIGYCANLAYYLLLKVQGKGIKDHPVIERLIKYRLLIEKIKPMEVKLQYQIDKLLNAAAGKAVATGGDDEDEKSLAFRPNLDRLESAGSSDESDSGAYKAPKVAPVHFRDSKSKVDKLDEREKILASRSRLLADIQADLEDCPEEESTDPVYGRSKQGSSSKKRDEYEEDNFLRLTLSKKELRQIEKQQAKPVDELEDLNDFFRETEKTGKSGKSALDRLLGTKAAKSKRTGGDDDVPAKRPKKQKKTSQVDDEIASDMSEIEDDLGEYEDDMYKMAKARSSFKKSGPQSKPVQYRSLRDSTPGADRPVTYEMMKNKGLTPHRPKEVRNPRVRQRQKWESAQKKIKSFKSVASGASKQYSGETSGIRTNVSRSVKF